MAERQRFPLVIDRWDSYFFKTPIARLVISGRKRYPHFSNSLAELISRARKDRIGYLVIKLENPGASYEKKLLHLGMRKCGESLDFKFSYAGKRTKGLIPNYDIGLFKSRYIGEMKAIASDAFRRSYLYKCGFGKKRDVDHYHAMWVENLSKDKNVHIFAAEKNNALIGFLILKLEKPKREGRIILISTHKKYRGKGVGRALMDRCIEWANGRVSALFVKTQKENTDALILYKRAGFRPLVHDKIFCRSL